MSIESGMWGKKTPFPIRHCAPPQRSTRVIIDRQRQMKLAQDAVSGKNFKLRQCRSSVTRFAAACTESTHANRLFPDIKRATLSRESGEEGRGTGKRRDWLRVGDYPEGKAQCLGVVYHDEAHSLVRFVDGPPRVYKA